MQLHVLAFAGPDPSARAWDLASRVTGLTAYRRHRHRRDICCNLVRFPKKFSMRTRRS